ncbi:hypothetical protein E2C01_029453 [Portunus trituberculatus]|uniref:Uncharacterized protein n=1 Tax=Portunus trituberculatus TaxID=210409 RepID=A0A5B7EN04_PORTR|nr:hypothetical protein [Portunus trituberculatus]
MKVVKRAQERGERGEQGSPRARPAIRYSSCLPSSPFILHQPSPLAFTLHPTLYAHTAAATHHCA